MDIMENYVLGNALMKQRWNREIITEQSNLFKTLNRDDNLIEWETI